MKYAVAYASFPDSDLKLTAVEADDPITAMIEGVREMMGASDRDPWLNGFLEKSTEPANYAARIEEIKREFFDVDQAVEVMPMKEKTLKARSLQLQSGGEMSEHHQQAEQLVRRVIKDLQTLLPCDGEDISCYNPCAVDASILDLFTYCM